MIQVTPVLILPRGSDCLTVSYRVIGTRTLSSMCSAIFRVYPNAASVNFGLINAHMHVGIYQDGQFRP
jgi:hypothetical protein